MHVFNQPSPQFGAFRLLRRGSHTESPPARLDQGFMYAATSNLLAASRAGRVRISEREVSKSGGVSANVEVQGVSYRAFVLRNKHGQIFHIALENEAEAFHLEFDHDAWRNQPLPLRDLARQIGSTPEVRITYRKGQQSTDPARYRFSPSELESPHRLVKPELELFRQLVTLLQAQRRQR